MLDSTRRNGTCTREFLLGNPFRYGVSDLMLCNECEACIDALMEGMDGASSLSMRGLQIGGSACGRCNICGPGGSKDGMHSSEGSSTIDSVEARRSPNKEVLIRAVEGLEASDVSRSSPLYAAVLAQDMQELSDNSWHMEIGIGESEVRGEGLPNGTGVCDAVNALVVTVGGVGKGACRGLMHGMLADPCSLHPLRLQVDDEP